MKPIIAVINDAIKQDGVRCLPCEKRNLDYERFTEYRDSEEHKATDLFEYPPPITKKIHVKVYQNIPSIFKFFLDGSRRTYKIADLEINGKYLPLIAGQVGVAIIRRHELDKMSPVRDFCCFEKVIAFPDQINKDDIDVLASRILKNTGLKFKLLRYTFKEDRDPVDLGIAKIMSHMADLELKTVGRLSDNNLLQSNCLLIKDGPLQYKNIKGRGFDITQFRNVIGLSKSFRPSFAVGKGRKKIDVGIITSCLEQGERTPIFKTIEEDKFIGMWYMRIRPREKMANPLQGIVKIECFAIAPEEVDNGLDADRVDTISAYLLQERNVTPYGSDLRWATHIYPIYLAEKFIKSNFLSDIHFENLF